jgi:spore coat polysaccharide biosynthesis protein SpsF
LKILAITQARVGSSRLPEKILKKIDGKSLLSIHLNRILQSKHITNLKVATTTEVGVEQIIDICNECGVSFYQGSLNDVLDRFYQTALPENPDWVVRLTSDCPLIDPIVIDNIIEVALHYNLDYTSNTLNPTYPDGIDVEVFKFSALQKAYNEAKLTSEREHVTPYIWKNSDIKGGEIFKAYSFEYNQDYSDIRLTVDTLEDFEVVEKLIQIESTSKDWLSYVNTLNNLPEIKEINQKYSRNEGYAKSLNSENK